MGKRQVKWVVGGCGSVAVLLLAVVVGGAYLFRDRVGKPLMAEIQSMTFPSPDWSALARTWQPPPENADPEVLFPASIGEFRRLEQTRAAAIDLGIEESGWRAVYASGGGGAGAFCVSRAS
jgi:hypothetical protein